MILQTSRLTLRPFQEGDFSAALELYQDPEVCRYLLHGPLSEVAFAARFPAYLVTDTPSAESTLHLAVLLGSVIIGDISLRPSGMHASWEIGYVFRADHWGAGYAREALSSLIRILFSEYAAHRIHAVLDARNTASARLCEALGMRLEAHFLQDYWSKGEWTDTLVYGCLEADLS